jgi:uncharacterized protein with beta-barrel porin domain
MSSFSFSLLGAAIATASLAQGALAVDLCAGQSSASVAATLPDDSCTLDTAGATLAVTADGNIGQGVQVSATGTTITNAGDIAGQTTAIRYQVFDAGSVFGNSGVVSVAGGSTAYALRLTTTLEGSLQNDSALTAAADTASGTAVAIGLQGGSLQTATLSSTGSITGDAAALSGAASAWGMNLGWLISGARLSNAGMVSARAEGGGAAAANAWGASVGNIQSAGFSNSGTINATAIAAGLSMSAEAHGFHSAGYGISASAEIVNSGTISTSATAEQMAYAWGLEMTNSLEAEGSISNTGAITATASGGLYRGQAYGIWTYWLFDNSRVDNAGAVSATASAQTSAAAWGIRTEGLRNSTSISNSGRITTSAVTALSGSARTAAILAGDVIDVARVQNGGLIRVSARNESAGAQQAVAAGIDVDALGSGAVVGNAGAIHATAVSLNGVADAFGIVVADLDGVVENSGRITVDAGQGGNAWTVYAQGGTGLLQNSGVLQGAVNLLGQVSLANTGSLLLDGQVAHVGGDFTQSGHGELVFPLLPAVPAGALQVDGTADFTDGPHLRVLLDPAQRLADGTRFDNLVTAGTLLAPGSGHFRIHDNSLFWRFEQTLTPTSLSLEAQRLDARRALAPSGTSLTPSQLALVDTLVAAGPTGPWWALAAAMETAPDAAAAAALLLQAGPAFAGAAAQATRQAWRGADSALAARLDATRGDSAGDAAAAGSLWLQPFTARTRQDAVQGIPGYELEGAGLVLGLDSEVTPALRLGAAVASTDSDVAGANARLDIEGLRVALYGRHALTPATTLDVDIGGGLNRYHGRRQLTFIGATASASYSGSQHDAGLVLTHRIAVTRPFALLPSLELRYSRVRVDRYEESGAGAWGLTVHDHDDDAFRAVARATGELTLPFGRFTASAGVGHDTAETALTAATFLRGPTFTGNGIAPDDTLYTAAFGFRHVTPGRLEFEIACEREQRDALSADSASLRLVKRF